MNCRECHDKLSLYLDGQLTDEERLRVEEALERCPECVEELNVLRELLDELGNEEEISVPTALLQDLKDAFQQEVAEKETPKPAFSLIQALGNWRIAASVAALLFASWTVYLDQRANIYPNQKTNSNLATGEGPRRRAESFETASAPEMDKSAGREGAAASQDTISDPDEVSRKVGNPQKGKSDFKNEKPAPGLNMRKDSGLIAKNKGQEDQSASEENEVMAPLNLKRDYELLERKMQAESEGDFEAEPLGSGIIAVLESWAGRHEKKGVRPLLDEKNKTNGFLRARKKVLPAKSKDVKVDRPDGNVAKANKAWTAKSSPKVPTTAYFALGEGAMKNIDSVAKESGLKYSTSSIGSLAKDKSASDLGSLLTFEVDEAQKDVLLRRLRSTSGLKLQLFGKTPAASPANSNADEDDSLLSKDKSAKPGQAPGSPAKAPKTDQSVPGKGLASPNGLGAKPKAIPPTLYRISFIVLAP
ncbi:MAG: hypothetical protein ACI97A_000610 [Planctomycetota bacterium]|jgi:hypothetical protein